MGRRQPGEAGAGRLRSGGEAGRAPTALGAQHSSASTETQRSCCAQHLFRLADNVEGVEIPHKAISLAHASYEMWKKCQLNMDFLKQEKKRCSDAVCDSTKRLLFALSPFLPARYFCLRPYQYTADLNILLGNRCVLSLFLFMVPMFGSENIHLLLCPINYYSKVVSLTTILKMFSFH